MKGNRKRVERRRLRDFAGSARAAADKDCCKVIFGAPTTSQCYEIDEPVLDGA